MVRGMRVELVELLADEDRVRVSLTVECDRVIPRCFTKTLTLEELDEVIERLTSIRDLALGEQVYQLAATATTASEPIPQIVEKVAGEYHTGSGV